MNRDEFYFLFVNANSLSELALLQFEEELAAMPELEVDSSPALTPAEIETRLAEQFKDMDLSALDGIDFDFFSSKPGQLAAGAEMIEAMPPFDETAAISAADDGPLDIGRYTEKAYSYEERLRPRVDAAFARADRPALLAALSNLPADRTPLTQRMTGVEMSDWLELYRAGHEGLSDLVVQIRVLSLAG